MLRMMRGPDGGPGAGVRILAALVVLGLLAVAAPLIVPLLRWLVGVF